ncbi:hypothetical protein AVEN_14863-1 [Araneus ventricosus]|uniref:Uncharacterized protein n=1 Tax=Araneus ventricosus TaxID=182803 RepID=A0A4Y2TDJ3_ARAVE|nr:hypothetical protein AVEN_14863-1 [Araneus ventricosus]
MKDRPPRQHSQALRPPHYNPHKERFMLRPTPVLPGYDLSSEMGPKSHATIIVPIRMARTCLLMRQLLIRELAVENRKRKMETEYTSIIRRYTSRSCSGTALASIKIRSLHNS